jgi:hypothetical protein
MQVHTVNCNGQTSNCQCCLFSKKNSVIWIFCISRCLVFPFNLDKWSSTVLQFHINLFYNHGCQIILGKEVCTRTLWSARLWHSIPWQVFTQCRLCVPVRFCTHISVCLMPQFRKPQYKCWGLWKPQMETSNIRSEFFFLWRHQSRLLWMFPNVQHVLRALLL